MNKYEITGRKVSIHATYKAGLLSKMEVKKGRLDEAAYDVVNSWLPLKESQLDNLAETWPALKCAIISGSKSVNLYTQFVKEWLSFYCNINGIQPKFTGTDGKALKQIEAYLVKVSIDEIEALGTWQLILGQYDKLPEYYRLKPDLPFINSKLNEIITQINKGTANPKSKAKQASDSLRENL
jgi:hypothetical protein